VGLGALCARLTPAPRVADWSLLALAAGALCTGVLSLGAGHPSAALLFLGHGAFGVALAAVLAVKLRRVRRRDASQYAATLVSGL
jgi:hypothetical protein